MEKFTVDGIIIRASVTGESDRIVWILTRNRGIIRAFAKGARGTKSRLHGGTSLFAYCTFLISEKNNVYNVSEAQVREIFFDLRKSMETLTLAQYFCEVAENTVQENASEEIYLRLLLNSLHFLCSGVKHEKLIKSVFELRMATVLGYMPSLVACDECGEFLTDKMYFDCMSGLLYCSACGRGKNLPVISSSVVSAMRHICYSEFSMIFSFEASEETLSYLNRMTENYLKNVTSREFRLLKYYNELKD